MSGCFDTNCSPAKRCIMCITNDLPYRFYNLEKHKNYQIDENRKVSRRLDELEKDFKKVEHYFYGDGDISDIQGQLDNLTKHLSHLSFQVENLEFNNIGQELDLKLWVFMNERLDKLERVLSETKLTFFEMGCKKPYKCPVCNGIGEKDNIHPIEQITNPKRFIKCSSCEGKGIVWG